MDHDRCDQRAANPVMRAPSAIGRESRQISADQQGLNEHETEGNNPRKPGQDVNRTAPCELLASRSSGDRHANGQSKGDPDQDHPGQSPPLHSQPGQAG